MKTEVYFGGVVALKLSGFKRTFSVTGLRKVLNLSLN